MTSFNDKIIETFGAWVADYAAILLIVAAVFALLFLVTVIGAIIRACVLKSRIKKLQAENAKAANATSGAENDNSALVSEIEQKQARIDELEEQLASAQAAAANAEYSDNAENTDTSELDARIAGLTASVDELNDELDEKQRTIAELEQKLKAAEQGGASGNADKAKIEKLERTIKDKDSEINLLKAENSQIKAQALQQQLAETRKTATEKTEKKPAAAKETERAEKVAAKADAPSAEDEYDEYYDDFGDETSAVKVTLKFDRVKNNWVILRTDTDRAYRRLSTKQEALMIAKDLARRLHAQLVVHKKDGKFQHV